MFDINHLNWPADGDVNGWADFVETLCLLSNGEKLSLEDFADFLLDDPGKELRKILTAINFNENFLAPLSVAVVVPIPSSYIDEDKQAENVQADAEDDFGGDDDDNEERERIRSRLITLFNFLSARQRYFAEFYPFNVDEHALTIEALESQSTLQSLYMVLLFSSEMQLYKPADRNTVGHLFEALCRKPFAQLVPALAEKKYFGAGGGKFIPADYQGNLKKKIQDLASDLNIQTTVNVNDPDELGKTGDAGLDWVGWFSFEDNCNHQPVYFGQCACGSDWVGKQHETSLSIWNNFLDLNQSVQCFHFMPRSFRRTSLEWFREAKIVRGLTLIDRYRLLKIFKMEAEQDLTEAILPYKEMLAEAEEFDYRNK